MEAYYTHIAQYYETDQMGVIHHSNYIRWFEEARVHFLKEMDMDYGMIEAKGIFSPVIGVEAEYKSVVRFGEEVEIKAWLKDYNGIRFSIGYEIREKESHRLCTLGSSQHCFTSKEGRPISLKKANPELHEGFLRMLG